jgi:hypothetical protein
MMEVKREMRQANVPVMFSVCVLDFELHDEICTSIDTAASYLSYTHTIVELNEG